MKVWIVDIDGTLAIMGDRSPYDWKRVGEDLPNAPVITVVEALGYDGFRIICMSGRMEQARQQTELWLDANTDFTPVALFMRADDDYRSDAVVKRELYETHVKPYYDIVGVIDDRGSVVRMWRELGLTVLDVAGNEF